MDSFILVDVEIIMIIEFVELQTVGLKQADSVNNLNLSPLPMKISQIIMKPQYINKCITKGNHFKVFKKEEKITNLVICVNMHYIIK